MTTLADISGAGLGLRREFSDDLLADSESRIDFLEIAPENWMGRGGKAAYELRQLTERYPFVTHGLSLSIGSPAELDEEFVQSLKRFLDLHQIADYSEHLTYCSDQGHLYDLMPIPFTEQAVDYVADRIRRVQDLLQRRIALENASYYAAPGKEMEEIDFVRAVLERADCDLLLDVNNIVVNSINHQYDARDYLQALPHDRVRYVHVAGHYVEAEDLRVDTHAATVSEPVWQLLDQAYELCGPTPTLLERDFNIPPLAELMQEVERIREIQQPYRSQARQHHG